MRNTFTLLNIEFKEKEEVKSEKSEAGEKCSQKKEAGDAETLLEAMLDNAKMLHKDVGSSS